jgi:hypothetical protein
MKNALRPVQPETLIPDLLREFPAARNVLDRYGLKGCGGAEGPHETLAFFARAHDVPVVRLLEEIDIEIREDRPLPTLPLVQEKIQLADRIYRPFFKAGIATILTLGAVWGAFLLLRIAFSESFTAIGYHEVNAHGHAQIFGWVGLFVMGFAYQAFPRFKHTSLAFPKLALATLFLMGSGIVIRGILEPIASGHITLTWLVVAASWGEVAAIAAFAGIILHILLRAEKQIAFYDAYILSALGWFVVQAVYETLLLSATLRAVDADSLVSLVATFQAPLREIQIHGFAMLMILGVSQHLFSRFYGFPSPNSKRSLVYLVILNVGLVAETFGFFAMKTWGHAWAGLWYAGVLALVLTVTKAVTEWGYFSSSKESDRSLKFLRAAYGWLLLSLWMLAALPLYQYAILPALSPGSEAARMGFSHAYYGAIRHAITVGFISLMIVGVSAKVVPTLNGVNPKNLGGLWPPFVLINLGCATRVGFQTLTDFTDLAFPVAGVSGILEVSGLAVWGFEIWRIMNGWKPASADGPARRPLGLNERIELSHRVAEVLEVHPHLLTIFVRFGFTPLQNSFLRRTLGSITDIETGCRRLGLDPHLFLQVLNDERTCFPEIGLTEAKSSI